MPNDWRGIAIGDRHRADRTFHDVLGGRLLVSGAARRIVAGSRAGDQNGAARTRHKRHQIRRALSNRDGDGRHKLEDRRRRPRNPLARTWRAAGFRTGPQWFQRHRDDVARATRPRRPSNFRSLEGVTCTAEMPGQGRDATLNAQAKAMSISDRASSRRYRRRFAPPSA